MLGRCYNLKHEKYERYGGRGILVCDRWHIFENFVIDMGDRPKGKTIERLDNDKHYCPENCVWTNAKVQANNRRNNLTFTYNGKTQTFTQWVEELNAMGKPTITYNTAQSRIRRGWDFLCALTTPLETSSPTKEREHHINFIFTYMDSTKHLKLWVDEFNSKRDMQINYNAVRTRIRNGWNFLDALNTPLRTNKYEKTSLIQLVKQGSLQLNYNTVKNRIRKGWDLTTALNTPTRKG